MYEPAARAVHFRAGLGPVNKKRTAKKRMSTYFWRPWARLFQQAYGAACPVLANLAWTKARGIARTRRFTDRLVPPAHEYEAYDVWTGIHSPLKLTAENADGTE